MIHTSKLGKKYHAVLKNKIVKKLCLYIHWGLLNMWRKICALCKPTTQTKTITKKYLFTASEPITLQT